MKKVVLITNQYSTNIGDLFISESLLGAGRSLQAWDVSPLPFLYYRGRPGNKLLQALISLPKVFQICRGKDLIIVAGGNLILPQSLRFSFALAVYGLVSRVLKVPLIFLFLGASNRPQPLGTKLAKFGLTSAHRIVVRDRHSADVVTAISNKAKPEVAYDGAFLSGYQCQCGNLSPVRKKRVGIVPLAFEQLQWNEQVTSVSRDEYENLYKSLTRGLLERGFTVKFITTAKEDLDFAANLSAELEIELLKPSTVEELLDAMCYDVECLIGTRMHALVAAMVCGKKFIAVKWQHKVAELLFRILPAGTGIANDITPKMDVEILKQIDEGKWMQLSEDGRAHIREALFSIMRNI